MLFLGIFVRWPARCLSQPVLIERSGDPLADIVRLIVLQPEDWQACRFR